MKKYLILLALALALIISCVACTGDDPVETTPDTTADAPIPDTPAESEDETEPSKVTDPIDVTEPETPKASEPEETTKAPEPTKEPDTTEKPEDPTEPPVTEPVDPTVPIGIYYPADLDESLGDCSNIASMVIINDYLSITPTNGDPNYFPFANVDGGRYVAIKYRTSTAVGMAVQFYISSSGSAPSDDTSMLRQSAVVDGAWHVAVFDTQPLIDAGIYDGEYVSYFRFDPLECDYMLDENGNPLPNNQRYPMPEGAQIDIAYVAFFNDPAAAVTFDCKPSYFIGAEEINAAANSSSNATASEMVDDYAAISGTGGDGYINLISAGMTPDLNSRFIAMKYRTTSGPNGEFFVGSGGGPAGAVDEQFFDYTPDGQWNLVVVNVTGVSALTGNVNYLRLDYFQDCTDRSIDIKYIAFFDSAEKAYAYEALQNIAPDATASFKSDISTQEIGTKLDQTDLTGLFGMHLPTGGCAVEDLGGEKVYVFSSINEMVATMDGAYYVKANCLASDANGALIVRGYQAMTPDSLIAEKESGNAGVYIINNFYETDCNGLFGGAGIYLHTDGSNLYINIKTYNPDHFSRIYNNILTVPTTGSDITVVDTGALITVMVNGDALATIELKGEKVYDDIQAANCPMGNTFAAKAIVNRYGCETVVIENTLVAASVNSQIAVAARAGIFKFSSIEVGPASAITPACIKELPREDINAEHSYVADGLVSLYGGVTKDGYWYDLVGTNDLPINVDSKNYGDMFGLHINSAKHYFPTPIVNLVNGDAFTVEISVGDFEAYGEAFQTLMNSNNDNFALFRRVSGDYLEFKFAGNPGGERPHISGGMELIDNGVISVTYVVGGDMCLYVDGQLLDTKPAPNVMGADTMFIGHIGDRAFSTLYKSLRFYNRALSADEIAANYAVDQANEISLLTTDKTTYTVGEPIMTTAIGSGKDWVGIYAIDDVYPNIGSIYWYYPADYAAGEAVNIRGISVPGSDQVDLGREGLPAGEYKIILFADDGYDVIEQVNITIVEAAEPAPTD